MRIATKRQFQELADSGHAGNMMPSWGTEAEARASGYQGSVMIRSRTPNSPYMRADVPMDDVAATIDGLAALGADRDALYLTHMTAGVGRRINGELWRGPGGLYLNYSTAQTHLRAALEHHGRHAERSAALAVLRWACGPDDLDDLMTLLDNHPDAVIEFTAYDAEIGTVKHRNVVVWELRDF